MSSKLCNYMDYGGWDH